MGLERHTSGSLSVLQLLDRGEMSIHQDGIGEGPQMFGWLQFRRIRRQEEQVDVVGNPQALGAVPPRPIQDEDDLLGRTGAHSVGKGGELGFEERDAHTRRQVEDRAA